MTWSGLGLIAGLLIAGATIVSTVVSFFIPSLAIYQVAPEICLGQQRVSTERQRLNHLVTAELRAACPGAISNSEWRRLRRRAAQGIEVKDRGRVPAELVVKFKAAAGQ